MPDVVIKKQEEVKEVKTDRNIFEDVLGNKELLSKVRFWFIIAIFLASPLIYALFFTEINIQGLINPEVTGLGVLGILLNMLMVTEFKSKAFEIAIKTHSNIANSFVNLKTKREKITFENQDIAFIVVDECNDTAQKNANTALTKHKKNKAQNKIMNRKMKSKNILNLWGLVFYKTHKLQSRLEFLKTNELYNKKFKPLKYPDVLNTSGTSSTNFKAHRENYTYNHNKENWYIKIMLTPVKFLGFGAGVLTTFMLGIPIMGLFVFYLILIGTTLFMGVWKYFVVYNRITTKTYKANLNMIELLDKIEHRINNPIIEEKDTD